ncbi:uncharacterized protein K452DRAFT_361586 [Aplosporella prunicola CBS 121167]|uniref:Uncharacterized protein n=1 Tax=Aplosporella prunicola CBS 121167 TaxID=1176127 RepID=A0A6A6B2S9_9PEZI|nr:uncharacterized protein K452DRAFT_361586 [Aplosporella prunicola CBS 121167]KAF2138126.1 hypothetical protein K452DRAFT_361586 [Aplosporella prunicola CBS 121167]
MHYTTAPLLAFAGLAISKAIDTRAVKAVTPAPRYSSTLTRTQTSYYDDDEGESAHEGASVFVGESATWNFSATKVSGILNLDLSNTSVPDLEDIVELDFEDILDSDSEDDPVSGDLELEFSVTRDSGSLESQYSISGSSHEHPYQSPGRSTFLVQTTTVPSSARITWTKTRRPSLVTSPPIPGIFTNHSAVPEVHGSPQHNRTLGLLSGTPKRPSLVTSPSNSGIFTHHSAISETHGVSQHKTLTIGLGLSNKTSDRKQFGTRTSPSSGASRLITGYYQTDSHDLIPSTPTDFCAFTPTMSRGGFGHSETPKYTFNTPSTASLRVCGDIAIEVLGSSRCNKPTSGMQDKSYIQTFGTTTSFSSGTPIRSCTCTPVCSCTPTCGCTSGIVQRRQASVTDGYGSHSGPITEPPRMPQSILSARVVAVSTPNPFNTFSSSGDILETNPIRNGLVRSFEYGRFATAYFADTFSVNPDTDMSYKKKGKYRRVAAIKYQKLEKEFKNSHYARITCNTWARSIVSATNGTDVNRKLGIELLDCFRDYVFARWRKHKTDKTDETDPNAKVSRRAVGPPTGDNVCIAGPKLEIDGAEVPQEVLCKLVDSYEASTEAKECSSKLSWDDLISLDPPMSPPDHAAAALSCIVHYVKTARPTTATGTTATTGPTTITLKSQMPAAKQPNMPTIFAARADVKPTTEFVSTKAAVFAKSVVAKSTTSTTSTTSCSSITWMEDPKFTITGRDPCGQPTSRSANGIDILGSYESVLLIQNKNGTILETTSATWVPSTNAPTAPPREPLLSLSTNKKGTIIASGNGTGKSEVWTGSSTFFTGSQRSSIMSVSWTKYPRSNSTSKPKRSPTSLAVRDDGTLVLSKSGYVLNFGVHPTPSRTITVSHTNTITESVSVHFSVFATPIGVKPFPMDVHTEDGVETESLETITMTIMGQTCPTCSTVAVHRSSEERDESLLRQKRFDTTVTFEITKTVTKTKEVHHAASSIPSNVSAVTLSPIPPPKSTSTIRASITTVTPSSRSTSTALASISRVTPSSRSTSTVVVSSGVATVTAGVATVTSSV